MVQESGEIKKLVDLKTDFDEGLGTVYERFRLNYIFERLLKFFEIKNIKPHAD